MIGSKDESEHKYRRIYKVTLEMDIMIWYFGANELQIGDFGISKFESNLPAINDVKRRTKMRRYGTRGWLLPVSFQNLLIYE